MAGDLTPLDDSQTSPHYWTFVDFVLAGQCERWKSVATCARLHPMPVNLIVMEDHPLILLEQYEMKRQQLMTHHDMLKVKITALEDLLIVFDIDQEASAKIRMGTKRKLRRLNSDYRRICKDLARIDRLISTVRQALDWLQWELEMDNL